MRTCPECGGELIYDRVMKEYVCKACGLMISREELFEERRKAPLETPEERNRKRRSEYLKWWLSKK